MTTFGADGSATPDVKPQEQMTAPPEFDPKPEDTTPAVSREEPSLAPAAPELRIAEREADYQAAQGRVDAGLPPEPGDPAKLANRPSVEELVAEPEVTEPVPPTPVTVEDASTSTAVALFERFDVTTTGEVWQHDFLEFEGDKLGIRLPLRQALAAFSLASSKYVSLGVKNDLTGLFIARHLSQESYGRVFSRLMDPDDQAYDVDTVGELFNAIVTAAISADKADEAEK